MDGSQIAGVAAVPKTADVQTSVSRQEHGSSDADAVLGGKSSFEQWT